MVKTSYVREVAYDRRVVSPRCSNIEKDGAAGMSELPKPFSPTFDGVTVNFVRGQIKMFFQNVIFKNVLL